MAKKKDKKSKPEENAKETQSLQLSAQASPFQYQSLTKSKSREFFEAVITALILALLIRAYVVQAYKIPSGSMIPTLLIGDHILVNKFIYGFKIPFVNDKLLPFREIQRGDIIVFKYPEDHSKDYIKRVIGVGGDTVEIIDKTILINNKPIEDAWGSYDQRSEREKAHYGPEKVPEHHFFVLGDNRNNSRDSRYWGFVDINEIRGKAFLIYFSIDSAHAQSILKEFPTIRWERIARLLK
jgi:signal peptidase I